MSKPKKNVIKFDKKAQRNLERKQKEKIKYDYVLKLTGNAKLAQQARGWGNERLLQELSVVFPKKIPVTKKELTPKQKIDKKTKQRKLVQNKIDYAKRKGFSDAEASALSLQTYKRIDLELKYRNQYRISEKHRLSRIDKRDRMDKWASWGKYDDYPFSIRKQAQLINLRNNLDVNESYGYAIMYYAFTTNKDPQTYVEQYKVDKATGRMAQSGAVKVL